MKMLPAYLEMGPLAMQRICMGSGWWGDPTKGRYFMKSISRYMKGLQTLGYVLMGTRSFFQH